MSNELIKFWCNEHGHEYSVERSRTKPFCTREHLSIEGFPYEDYTKYCCRCAVYWKDEGGEAQCLRGKHQITRRYLCDVCKVMSLDTDDRTGKKFFISDDSLPNPSCPGCRLRAKSLLSLHECKDLLVSFWTAHTKCLFCKREIERTEEEKKSVEAPEPVVKEKPAEVQEPYMKEEPPEDQEPPNNPPPEVRKEKLEIVPQKLDFGRVSQNKTLSKPKKAIAKNIHGSLKVKPTKRWLEITKDVIDSENNECSLTIRARIEDLKVQKYHGEVVLSDSNGSEESIDCSLEVTEPFWDRLKVWTSAHRTSALIAAVFSIIAALITIYAFFSRPDPKMPPALKVDVMVLDSPSNPIVHIGLETTLRAIVSGKNDGNLTYKWSDDGRGWVSNSERENTTIKVPKDTHKKLPFETTVTVEVKDGSGVSGRYEKKIMVTNNAPKVKLSITPDKPEFQSGDIVTFSVEAGDEDEDDRETLDHFWEVTWGNEKRKGSEKEFVLDTSQITLRSGSIRVSAQVEVKDQHGGKGEDKKEIDITAKPKMVKTSSQVETRLTAQVDESVRLEPPIPCKPRDEYTCLWEWDGGGKLEYTANKCIVYLNTRDIDANTFPRPKIYVRVSFRCTNRSELIGPKKYTITVYPKQ